MIENWTVYKSTSYRLVESNKTEKTSASGYFEFQAQTDKKDKYYKPFRFMDVLIDLMKELSSVLRTRIELGVQTEQLAKEVLSLPKLPTLTADDLHNQQGSELLKVLQQKLNEQQLTHEEEEGYMHLQQILEAVALVRAGLCEFVNMEEQRALVHQEAYETELSNVKDYYAELQQRKQDVLMKCSQKLQTLESMANDERLDVEGKKKDVL